ncbi:MAG: TetR/AcrR family transcriptional regulator [Candidatus Eremiobacteraeota bacterium]|nr:TetR/AcrR family transcriptional regulator [Candidatus Eremiobacteraeota bacterium]MCW5869057.1 TetR/AcrR family transcriptional regulator [Candidatus Eremiobacteraeota bacterium]
MRKGDITKQLIVTGALKTVEEIGLEALTFAPLAAQLGISKSGIFAHFRTREDLLKAVLERASQEFVDSVLIPAVKESRGLPRLRKIFQNWVDYYQHGRRRIFIYDGGAGSLRDFLRDIHYKWGQEIQRAIGQAIEEGDLSPGVCPEQLTFDLYGAVLSAHHYKHILRDEQAPAKAERTFELLLRAQVAT